MEAAQAATLAGLVRLSQLSRCYQSSVLPQLPWLVPVLPQLVQFSNNPQPAPNLLDAWFKPARPISPQQLRTAGVAGPCACAPAACTNPQPAPPTCTGLLMSGAVGRCCTPRERTVACVLPRPAATARCVWVWVHCQVDVGPTFLHAAMSSRSALRMAASPVPPALHTASLLVQHPWPHMHASRWTNAMSFLYLNKYKLSSVEVVDLFFVVDAR